MRNPKEKLRALLVDPFQHKIHEVNLDPGIQNWYKLCDCDCFDHCYLGTFAGARHDAFVDDEGLLKEPTYPLWHWHNYPNPLPGYGLITACDDLGVTIPARMTVEFVLEHISWELWEARLNAADYFDQLSRIYL